MKPRAPVFREKRLYNKWVASQTLEDYALRYTADHARRWSVARVANTAVGAAAFLACEAIGASITLVYGFANSVAAIGAAVVVLFLTGLPIAYRAARHGLDIDLLTRGAGFGYMGSTITSLIYASFTFLLFSVEAGIMAVALAIPTGLPLGLTYMLSALAVIPIALHGMRTISRFQWATQPLWIVLQLAPAVYLLWLGPDVVSSWVLFTGQSTGLSGLDLVPFGFAFSTLLSLMPQIGEQADYLRFLPQPNGHRDRRWLAAVIIGGPGWAIIGGLKLLLGALLVSYAVAHGVANPNSPSAMFDAIFLAMTGNPALALMATCTLIVVSQLKINVTNAYAGSIAWSNFFARLTHNHPGRVVWLVFNTLLAILLMEVGFADAISTVLILYANIAVAWLGALAADLVVSKPLGLSPPEIEFKRAHLYDINPVGVGAMALSILLSGCALFGLFGLMAQAFASVIGLIVAFVAAPAIAWLTRGRYYIARRSVLPTGLATQRCVICENDFQTVDTAWCPFYAAPICSLCCTLESRCYDRCKTNSRATEQCSHWLERVLPGFAARYVHTKIGHFTLLYAIVLVGNAGLLVFLSRAYIGRPADEQAIVDSILISVFLLFSLLGGIACWLVVLAHDSRRAAMRETGHHLRKLSEEIAAHEVTDAKLERAKEAAESANAAKSRYLASVSHEIRSPLNSIFGYAQLLERGGDVPPDKAAKVIRRSAEHLTNLVDGLLDIAQVENGVLRLSNDTIAFPSFLDQIASMFRYQATSKGLTFVYDRPERLPAFVRTDQKRLRQILINLLSNAVKFTRRGTVAFRIGYRSQMATFEVEDTGPGIAPDDIRAIFAPFERGNGPQARDQPGVGLGLSITNALVQILGGEIGVVSPPGLGARFTVRLMLGEVAGHALPAAPSGVVVGYRGPRATVAIVDDDAEQLALVHNILEPLGLSVVDAGNGLSGVTLCEERRPDLVLLDISMPGQSGWVAAAAVRRALGASIRIVMLSADAHEYRAGGEDDVHDRFLVKPFEVDQLLETIGDLLHLEWIVEERGTAPASRTARPDGPADLPPEARPHLEEIVRLVRMGHVRGIEGAIKTMAQAVPETGSLATELLRYLDSFDLRGLADRIGRSLP